MRTCWQTEELAFPIKLEQSENRLGRFRVTYGKQVRSGLSYGDAAKELGSAIMHALACDGQLDNRDDEEIAERAESRKVVGPYHWPEMIEIRRNTNKCPYCGKQEPAAKGYVFCPHCLDSEYLTEDYLLKGMTRMRAIDEDHNELKPLTDAERAHLLPLYREAQLHGNTERGKARIAKQRQDIERNARAAIRNAETERAGMLWLMDHGINISNVIYYSHTGRFGFGWRQPLGGEVLSGLLDIITEFPFPYDIETTDKRKLSGER